MLFHSRRPTALTPNLGPSVPVGMHPSGHYLGSHAPHPSPRPFPYLVLGILIGILLSYAGPALFHLSARDGTTSHDRAGAEPVSNVVPPRRHGAAGGAHVRRAKSPSEAGDAAARDVIFHNPWATIDLRAAQLPLPGGRHKTVDGWLWVAVRNHINALVQVQPEEALTIWGAAGLRAAALSRDVLVHPAPSGGVPRASLGAARVLVAAAAAAGRNEVGAHNEPLYVLYRQEKYAYLGPSLAVVGGLNEPETDATLHATVHRELREELGLVCRAVQSLGRFVNDANRGCGVFETFAASQCVASPRTEHDLAEADVEAQAPVLLTAADLRDILRRTRDAAELGVRVPKAMGTFPAVVVPDGVSAETGAGLERPALNAYAAAGRDESAVWVTDISGLYIKESKWAATVALGLEYFTH